MLNLTVLGKLLHLCLPWALQNKCSWDLSPSERAGLGSAAIHAAKQSVHTGTTNSASPWEHAADPERMQDLKCSEIHIYINIYMYSYTHICNHTQRKGDIFSQDILKLTS